MIRRLTLTVATLVAVAAAAAGQASAAAIPTSTLGANVRTVETNGTYTPSDLSLGSSNGLGLVRLQAIEGTNMSAVVTWLAKSHLTLYPTLGLPCPSGTSDCTLQTQIPPATAASEMRQYITLFAQKYGPKGTFWSQNPSLPYEPITRYEIGNEPNIRMVWVEDGTHLHWPRPGNDLFADMDDYAEVYEAARTALHKVQPSGVAVVGGLADSASLGVDVQSDVSLLKALTRGAVDAVGYHPWTYDVSNALTLPDTLQLRDWMDANGYSGVPIDVNELGACGNDSGPSDGESCYPAESSSTWGSTVASYTGWAVCTSWMHVADLQPFYWGAVDDTGTDVWLPLVDANGTPTAYGTDYFNEAKSLTTSGCPSTYQSTGSAPTNTAKPTIKGTATSGSKLTGSAGTWTGSPTLYYQWVRCDSQGRDCADIAGANSITYTLTNDDEGSTDALIVIARTAAGSLTEWSGRTAVIAAPPSS